MSSDPGPLCEQILIVVFTIINGLYAASDKAFTQANRSTVKHLAETGSKKAQRLHKLLETPNNVTMSIRVLTITLWLVVCLMAVDLFMTDKLSLVIIIVAVILLYQVVESFPRRIAMQHTEKIALGTAWIIQFAVIICKPIVLLVYGIVFVLLKLFRQRTDINEVEYSEEDIVSMLEAGQESGELKEEGKKMITGIFAFDDLLAYEIMTPRTDVFDIDINDPEEEYIDKLMELRYSRIPVYEDDNDNIIGILNVKDYLIKAREEGFDNVDFRQILREPYLVPDTKNVDSLFFELQKTKQHIAILIDEYGGFSGIVTMEDIIEEVMGDIDDEYDEEEPEIVEIEPNTYSMVGGMSLDDINEEIGTDLESDTSETIGGYIIDILGEIPDDDDLNKEIRHNGFAFTINSVKDRRIERLIMKIVPEEDLDKKQSQDADE